jgi:uncharacterized membrane protein
MTRMYRDTTALALGVLLAAFLAVPAQAAPLFTGIGIVPGLAYSRALGVSADGSVVVGVSGPANGGFAVRWTETWGLELLMSGGTHQAMAASADGGVIVGETFGVGFRWTPSHLTEWLPGTSAATAVSGDGSVIVGYTGNQAFRWTEADGVTILGSRPGEETTRATGVSADGSIIVGVSGTPGGASFALSWTDPLHPDELTGLQGPSVGNQATAISADGTVIVGASVGLPVRWTPGHWMAVPLDLLPGDTTGVATAVSGDGSVIVGQSGTSPFVWTATGGTRLLHEVLTLDYGLDLTGWVLSEVTGISADGAVIVGWGINPSGQTEGWVAKLRGAPAAAVPEPAAFTLFTAGLAGAIAMRRRRA